MGAQALAVWVEGAAVEQPIGLSKVAGIHVEPVHLEAAVGSKEPARPIQGASGEARTALGTVALFSTRAVGLAGLAGWEAVTVQGGRGPVQGAQVAKGDGRRALGPRRRLGPECKPQP